MFYMAISLGLVLELILRGLGSGEAFAFINKLIRVDREIGGAV
jgi:hypothetical protein